MYNYYLNMRSKSIWILLSILGLSQLTGGTESWSGAQRKQSGPPSFLSHSPSSDYHRPAASKQTYDYSNGFPQGFAQGLPTFDFSGPMASAGENKEQVAEGSDAENAGFVQGPPEGFPTLEQLGGKFPNFGESVEQPSSSQLRPFRPSQSSRPPSFGPPQEEYDDYGPGPGGPLTPENSDDAPVEEEFDGPPQYRRGPPPPPPPPRPAYSASSQVPHGPPGPPYSPFSVQASGGQQHSKYTSGSRPSFSPQPKKPIYIKTSGKNNKLPSGPPVFYAPSPDKQTPQSSSSQQHGIPSDEYSSAEEQPSFHPRYRRSTPDEDVKEEDDSKPKDLKSAATESETFWELTSSPFIVFDTYKNNNNEKESEVNASHADHDGDEQRFFPSFPAPAPYLVGPFGGGPPSRPPLFPGPAANRAPSRYVPSFGPKFSPPPPPPNRGPSNVYTAESHDSHYQDNNLLGSGNFEVVRGGTYYGEDDDGYHGGGGAGSSPYHEHDDGEYFHHNGHSSPQEGYRVPGGDFFANFRDFADINPPSRAFSHNHETLAAEPRESVTFSSRSSRQPKNILDKLENPTDNGAAGSSTTSNRDSDPMMATF